MSDSNPDFTTEDREFRQELLDSADRLDKPRQDLQARLLERIAPEANRRSSGWWLAAVAGLALVAVGGGTWILKSRQPNAMPPVRPEAASERSLHPCSQAFRAEGTQPLVDDFEDSDSRSARLEGRGAPWLLHFDYDSQNGALRFLRADPRPEPKPDNRFALHLVGPELRDWGAVSQVTFKPHDCYDASAYAGLKFWGRGPGRLFAGVQVVSTTPRKWGGTCEKDCYKHHVHRIDLESGWKHYSLRWEELRQRGYDTKPLDPSEIYSLVFSVQSADTPFDLWLDDVAFIKK